MKLLSFFKWLWSLLEKRRSKRTQSITKSAPAKREPYVYVTPKGKKFHYDLLCPGIRNAKEIKMDLSKARKAGYTACDKCCWEYLHK